MTQKKWQEMHRKLHLNHRTNRALRTGGHLEKHVLRVILKRGKSKPFWLGHPWVFSGAVEKVVGPEAKQGGPCVVVDERENVVGWGHYNPHARIAVRILEHRRTTEVSFEPPTFTEFLAERIGKARAMRERLSLIHI